MGTSAAFSVPLNDDVDDADADDDDVLRRCRNFYATNTFLYWPISLIAWDQPSLQSRSQCLLHLTALALNGFYMQ